MTEERIDLQKCQKHKMRLPKNGGSLRRIWIQEACLFSENSNKFTAAMILSKASRPLLSMNSVTDERA